MHKLPLTRFFTFVAIISLSAFAIMNERTRVDASGDAGVVVVLYAGSLVTPMEGPIKAALQEQQMEFEGEPGGSKALANLILAGVRTPDVFISVDPQLVRKLGDRVESATTFAGTSLGVACAPNSKFAALFDQVVAGKISLKQVLETPGIRIGRTDPQLDPKGTYTLEGVTIWLGRNDERRLLGEDENPAQIFPEQDLLARVDTGQADIGFFYRTEAIARGYRFIPLPGKAALTDRITYTLAVLKAAPHPTAAKKFAQFILARAGRTILERAGLEYLQPAAAI